MNLFLAPASSKNISYSIDNPVRPQLLEAHLSSTSFNAILASYASRKQIYCWGMSEGSRGCFRHMQPKDIVLLSVRGTGKFAYEASIALTMECPSGFSRALWPFEPNAPWPLVYFLNTPIKRSINKSAFVEALGYAPPDRVQKVRRVKPEYLQAIASRYGSISRAIDEYDER
jgi:hypothetical protein